MILHLNHTRRECAAATTGEVVNTVLALLEEKQLEPTQFARLRIYLDWLQYKQNFREPVTVTRPAENQNGSSAMEIRIDSRQVVAGSLREMLQQSICAARPDSEDVRGRVYLEEFKSFRNSI